MSKNSDGLDSNTPIIHNQICQIPNISEKLLETIKGQPGHESNYIEFVKKFFLYIPSDYLSIDKLDLFYEFSKEAFAFFKVKETGKRKLLITSDNNDLIPTITILLLNDNKSFIIDSLNCLLVKLNLHPKFMLHPTIHTVRDQVGNLESILDKNVNANESLVFIKIVANFDFNLIHELEVQINNIMDLVDQVNESRDTILDEIEVCKSNITLLTKTSPEYTDVGNESIAYLEWLAENNFTFLGFIKFDSSNILKQVGASGIWENHSEQINATISNESNDLTSNSLNHKKLILLGRINVLSPVYQNKLVDYILIKSLNQNGQYEVGTIFFGLYNITMLYQSIQNIPLLRDKIQFSLAKSGFTTKEYNYKKLMLILESFPKEMFTQIHEEDLYCMASSLLSSMMSHKLKLFIYNECKYSLINILIFLPKERLKLSTQKMIIQFLKQQFNGEVVANFITPVTADFAHLFVTIAVKNVTDFVIQDIENHINNISELWNESLYNKLSQQTGEYQASLDIKQLDPIFSEEYKNKYNTDEAIIDIGHLKEASTHQIPIFNLQILNAVDFNLKLYSTSQIPLYTIIPAIENLGFKAIDERSFHIKPGQNIQESWLYEFILHSSIPIEKEHKIFKENIEEALDKMWHGKLAIDSLSKLIGLAGLNWKEVKLIKALTRYLHQTGFIYGKGYVQLTLNKHYKFVENLIALFDAKFNPKTHSDDKVLQITNQIKEFLTTITSSAEDKVLRHMHNLIEAMIRTNYFQSINGQLKNYISFKFNSEKILELVRPVPYAEIFVYSNEFEALHLRGGRVARGGIRLSDRGEDYRTEVLGLMKAQMSKNTLIIPVGSKGGVFVTLNPENYSPADYKKQVIECYKNFLRGLLDITDNIIQGQIIFPNDTIRYDGPDPYLVVAADKGTATFSDYANEISNEYNFWLRDAFASGGSVGYDHKKIGITAKGAWISVIRHFESLGRDVHTQLTTVVGIGDMSGDVFGNGLLRSRTMALLAAFNHIQIFLDPNPDPEKSFIERERLFNLPGSKWTDYNPQLISEGGGVFERSAKTIKLSSQIKTILDLSVDEISPDQLIKSILKANVDLIWNGGIGTYIKATTESHLEIGDKANDNLRCNGKEIKAKVIAEGGNLGCSQLGRIEYSKNGGLINTDFIDNSGGVDCSDHEVNIKIALNHAVSSGKITIDERNHILESMTNEVEQLVLMDNYKQTQAITIASLSPALNLEMFSELMNSLEEDGLLDRVVEFLPSRAEISKRSNEHEKLTRPEHAVILAYSKMACFNELEKSPILEDSYLKNYLIHYFPSNMQEDFKDEILNHQLGNDIIRTVISNNIINQLGGALINTLKRETSGNMSDIMKSYLIICEIFDLNKLWAKVENLTIDIDHNIRIDLFTEIIKIMRRGTSWFIKNLNPNQEIMEVVQEYKGQAIDLATIISQLLTGDAKNKYFEKEQKYLSAQIDKELAVEICNLDSLISVLDIISISKNNTINYEEIANLYFLIGNEFHIDWLRRECDALIDDSYWNRLSIQSLKDDLYDKQKRLLIKLVPQLQGKNLNIKQWIEDYTSITKNFIDFVRNIKLQENININMIILANKKFEMFLRRLG